MQTRCNADRIDSSHHGRRGVTGAFDGGRLSSDGGAPLPVEADLLTGLTRGLADRFTDHRDPDRTGHGLRCPVARRVMGTAPGHGDINDHDIPPGDGVPAVGRGDVTGDGRRRESGRGAPPAGSGTPDRLGPGGPDRAADDRYRRIAADPEATGRLMPGMFPEAHGAPPERTVPGPDATDDPPRGRRECRFPHGHYRYLPLHVTCGGHVPCARLRPPDIDASHGALEGPARIVAVIRGAWPSVRITVRGDSGFRRDGIMARCGAGGVDSVSGLARNPRLERGTGRRMRGQRSRCVATGEPPRRFTGFGHRTLPAWSRSRRVVARAGALPGTIRARLPKVACRLRVGVRRIRLSLSRCIHTGGCSAGRWRRCGRPPGRLATGEPRARLPKACVAVPLFALCSRFRSHRRPADAAAGAPSAAAAAGRGRMTGRIGAGCPDSRSGEISGVGNHVAPIGSPIQMVRRCNRSDSQWCSPSGKCHESRHVFDFGERRLICCERESLFHRTSRKPLT